LIIVHSIAKPPAGQDAAGVASIGCRQLASNEPIPQSAIWIDLIEPTMEEDQKSSGLRRRLCADEVRPRL